MDKFIVKKAGGPVDICVEVPGSKSITNRALLMGAMSDGETILKGVLFSDDSVHFLDSLSKLGFKVDVDRDDRCVRILGQAGKIPRKSAQINVGSAGTAARFLTAFLAMNDGEYRIDSSEQMKKRPMKELLVVLENMGAKIEYLEEEYSFPMIVKGIKKDITERKKVYLNIDKSSQFLSALLMVAPLRFLELDIELTGKREARSYVTMTEQMMRQFGHPGVEQLSGDCYRVEKSQYCSKDYQIEPDVSAACYFYAMAAVTGGRAVVKHMRRDSLQGDMKFIDILCKMGCTKSWEDELVLYGPENGSLKGINESFSDFSDQALTAAAIAPFADNKVTITGIGHTRGQESDRVKVMAEELGKMGIKCVETDDSITIYPGSPRESLVETYDDHRVAMSFAVTGIRSGGITILNPDCCKKTFPEYFHVLQKILGR